MAYLNFQQCLALVTEHGINLDSNGADIIWYIQKHRLFDSGFRSKLPEVNVEGFDQRFRAMYPWAQLLNSIKGPQDVAAFGYLVKCVVRHTALKKDRGSTEFYQAFSDVLDSQFYTDCSGWFKIGLTMFLWDDSLKDLHVVYGLQKLSHYVHERVEVREGSLLAGMFASRPAAGRPRADSSFGSKPPGRVSPK